MPGLYIHIPFCQRKCGYCDFYSSVEINGADRFLAALEIEMKRISETIGRLNFDTLFLGGGTPSILNITQIEILIHTLNTHFQFSKKSESSIEINPGTITREKLKVYQNLNINRLSIGGQSFHDQELILLERIHNQDEIVTTFQMARSLGFQNIGLDLIYGFPNQTLSDWETTLKKTIDLQPEHISAYTLTWSEKTRLGQSILQGVLPKPDEDIVSDLFLYTHETLESAGYCHYEISNYAKPGFKCTHNQHYWDGTPYLGLGPSAHSFWNQTRWWNISDVEQYCSRLENNDDAVEYKESLSETDLKLETIALGLRTNRGIKISANFKEEDLNQLYTEGLAKKIGDRLVLTPRGMLLADEIAAKLA